MIHPSDMQGGAFGFVRNGYDRMEIHNLTAAALEGATVYGRDDETIGSIRSLQISTDGRITGAVIDVGGFLGIGVHSVLVPFSGLTVLRETDGSDLRVNIDTTKDKLAAMPRHDA